MTKLQNKIHSSDLTNVDIAHEMQISIATLWRKASGQSKIRPGEMLLFARILNLSKHDIKEIENEMKDIYDAKH